MSRLEIEWPDEGAERVRAARGRLVLAGTALRAMSLEERLSAVARVLGDWTGAHSSWRHELAESLADVTPFTLGTISEGLDSALRAWHPDRLIECARTELATAFPSGDRALVPFEWTTVLAGGSIPMPTILSGLLPLVLGSPVLLRETSKDSVTAALLARSLEARDERLARSFEHISFRSTDQAAFDVALEAPCVVASGSDETIASVSRRLDPRQRFVAHGHRFSIVLLGPDIANDPSGVGEVAEGIALDVARWDQSGCLSPVIVYLLEVDATVAEEIARGISEALTSLASSMPRGRVAPEIRAQISSERSEARMRSASGPGLSFEGSDHSVILEVDARPRPAPLHRFLRLMPVHSPDALFAALAPFSGHLSNIAMAGFPRGISADAPADSTHTISTDPLFTVLLAELSRLGVSRFTRPGHMQTPPVDWPHDGMPVFTPLARFAHST